jgi:hypothetical protein
MLKNFMLSALLAAALGVGLVFPVDETSDPA